MERHFTVVLEDGRNIRITGNFASDEEMIRFSLSIDPDLFDFNSISHGEAETN